jgi:hypothetical protein
MRATVWAIAKTDHNGTIIETVKSSPRKARAIRHLDRLNNAREDASTRYALQGDKVKR